MMTPAAQRDGTGRYTRWLPLVIFVAATCISLVRAPDVSYWTDEAASLSAAQRSLPELWAMLQNIDAVHGAYYALLHVWITVFGSSPLATRSLSALAIGGTVLGVYFLTRRLIDPRAALVAAGIAATLPRLTWAGIEARPAAFTALCAVWATVLLVRAWGRGAGAWAAYAVAAFFGITFNIYVALLVVAHAVTTLVLHRRQRRILLGFAGAAVVVLVVAAPLLFLVRSQQAQLGTSGDRSLLGILRRAFINMVFLGETPASDGEPRWFTTSWQLASVAMAVMGIALVILAVIRRTWAAKPRITESLALLVPWLVIPPAVIGVYSILAAPVFQPRYFTFVAPAAAILMTAGLLSLGRRWIQVSAATIYIALVLVVYTSQRTDAAKNGTDWQAAAALIAREAEPGDVIYFTPRYTYDGPLSHVTARRMAVAYPEAYEGLVDLTLLNTPADSASLDGDSVKLEDLATSLQEIDSLWVVSGTHYPQQIVAKDDAFLRASGFELTQEWQGTRSVIAHYERPAP